MNEEPFDRVVTAFGMAVLVAGGILALSLIMIVGVNRTRLRCPRCATRMEEKTDWAKAALTLGAAIIARGVAERLAVGLGRDWGILLGRSRATLLATTSATSHRELATFRICCAPRATCLSATIASDVLLNWV